MRFPFSAFGTSAMYAICSYALGSLIGDKRRKSAPNFRLCAPFCQDRLSMKFSCRCTLRPNGPAAKEPFCKEKMSMFRSELPDVKGVGNDKDVGGTAPPKSSREPLLFPLVRL